MQVRIVVADQGEARFFDIVGPSAPLRVVGRITDPSAHLHDRDLKSDRPGRVFDHASAAPGRRGAVAHHGTEGERRPRKHEAQRFARQIAEQLDAARPGGFERLVLMAGPSFLGLLRAALSKPLRDSLIAEVPKDLVHQGEEALRAHLTPEIFAP